MANVLTVQGLKKSYGKIDAVKGINFEVKEGEIFALIGPNGAGKSTTLRMVATILTPTDGTIEVEGHDVGKHPEKAREVMSYLPEEAGAYKNVTGIDYLRIMAALYTDDKATQKKYIERAREICGLGDRLKDKAKTYSKGMTRKLLLARTVMSEPRLAILDEPTSGLDVLNAFEIRTIVKNLAKEGMGVLLSSHNMLEIEYLSDRVGIIAGGIIHETGTSQALKEKHKAANLEEVFAAVAK